MQCHERERERESKGRGYIVGVRLLGGIEEGWGRLTTVYITTKI